jgi:hypothetical protein
VRYYQSVDNETVKAISLEAAFASLAYLPDRSPRTSQDDYYATLSKYRDGAIFVAHYAGTTEWERHQVGDEIVLVVDGETNLILLVDGEEQENKLGPLEFLVVPQGIWHRFDTPLGVRVLSVTPQPTDHQLERP